MGKGIKYGLCVLAGAVVLAVATAAVPPPDGFRMGRNMEVLVNMLRDISLFYVDDVDPDELLSDAAAGMTAGLDPYTVFISEEDMDTFQLLTTGRYGGVGSLIRKSGAGVVFAEPYKGSPADRAGIVVGDRILEIDGQDASAMTTEQVSSLMKGEPGTRLKMKVAKFYTGDTVQVELKREIINIPGIPYYGMLPDSVGYILNIDFTDEVSNDMRNAIMSLREQGAKALILDYRNNGGGIVQEAVKILSFFVPRGTEVVSLRGRNPEENAVFTTQQDPLDTEIPLVVLVNNGSASAAEIVAGALQDMDRAVLVGRRTFGKGLVQSTRPLGYNAYLKVTTAKYYLPSGRCIQAIDYASRAEDGTLSHIPDSLITEFRTAAGRRVYDGGGVMPDVRVPAEYVSRFAYVVYGKGYIHDFVDGFMRRNRDREIVPGSFALSDADYADFTAFMQDKDVEWESDTKRLLARLKESAEAERYMDSIGVYLEGIEANLDDDVRAGLQLYRQELTELIENEIVLRSAYNAGVVEHNMAKDPDVREALAVLNDPERYREILASKDTDRK